MVLRAVARARTSRMARSIDRSPACGFAAGDSERVRRGPAHQRAVEPDQRSRRAARRRARSTSRSAATISRKAAIDELSEFRTLAQLPNLPRELRSTQVLVRFGLRMIILVVFAAFGGIGFGRSLAALLWMSIILSAVVGADEARAAVRSAFSITGTKRWPMRRCSAWSAASITRSRSEAATRDLMRRL